MGYAQKINLIAKDQVVVKGTGSQTSVNTTIPAGNNRIVIVQYWVERDHRPNDSGSSAVGNSGNFPSSNLGRTAFSPTINNIAMTARRTDNYSATFFPQSSGSTTSNTYLSNNYHIYYLADPLLPTGAATINFGIPNAPLNSADDLVVVVSVYENVSSLSIQGNLPGGSGVNFSVDGSSSNSSTTQGSGDFSTPVAAATGVPVGRTANDVLYHGIIASSLERNITLSAGSQWNSFNVITDINPAGASISNQIDSRGLLSNESDGVYVNVLNFTGATTVPNLVFTKGVSGMTNYIRTHVIPLLPLSQPGYSGTVVQTGNNPANITGAGTNGGGAYINVIDANGLVVATVQVGSTGAFTIPTGVMTEGQVYKLALDKNSVAVGTIYNPASNHITPTNYYYTGESMTSTGNDGNADGYLTTPAVGTANVTGMMFGINTCNSGTTAPAVKNLNLACGQKTVDLGTAFTGSFIPAGTALVWYTNNAHTGTALTGTQITAASPGTYYAFFYDNNAQCYSPAGQVVVTQICAVADTYNPTTAQTSSGVPILGNVLTNDSYNNATPTTANVNITVTSTATPAYTGAPVPSVDPTTGNVVLPANVPVGTYTIGYQICDKLGAPCSSTTVTVNVPFVAISVCSDPNVIYTVGTPGIVPVNTSTMTTGPAFPSSGGGSPNALGYSVSTKKFYYFDVSSVPVSFVSYDPATGIKTSLAAPYGSPHNGGTVPRGVVTADGNGFYMINEGVEVYYYNIPNKTWTFITNKLVDQNGNTITTLKAPEVSGDIAIDSSNNMWILSSSYGGGSPAATHSLYKISAPLPTTAVASLKAALLLQSAPNPNNETFTGIAFNPSGQIYLGSPKAMYLLNNDFSITPIANIAGLSDLASCSLPTTAFPQDVSGNVYNDLNGLGGIPANTIDGTGTNLGGALKAVLIDRYNGNVVAVTPVNADGTYKFPQTSAGIYTIEITTANATVGSTAPAATLPLGWSNVGENLGSGPGTDGTPDGKLDITVSGAPISNANFGVFKDLINAVNDINQTPQGVTVSGSLLLNDDSTNKTVNLQSATYYNATGVVTPLPIGSATDVYALVGGKYVVAGSITLKTDGTYTFTPASGFIGNVPINYVANNGAGATDAASLQIKVLPPANSIQNNNPIGQNDVSRTIVNVPVSGNALVNDSDLDGNSLTVSGATFNGAAVTLGNSFTVSGIDSSGNAVTNAGSITLKSDGTYTYIPATGFEGKVNPVTYTVSDGKGGSDTAQIFITVYRNLGNTTFANDDAQTAPKGTAMNGNVSLNDSDPEGNATTVTGGNFITTDASGKVTSTALTLGTSTSIAGIGTVTLNADGTYKYQPDPNYVGTTQVVYTKCDNGSPVACDTATLYLTTIDTVTGYCYKMPTQSAGVTNPTQHGITAFNRAGSTNVDNWPMVRQSAWTALEASTKGFVVNRVSFDATGNPVGIAADNFVEGMMVYDTTNNCLKIYNGTVWSCYSTPGCP